MREYLRYTDFFLLHKTTHSQLWVVFTFFLKCSFNIASMQMHLRLDGAILLCSQERHSEKWKPHVLQRN